jgi:hypothetical protein
MKASGGERHRELMVLSVAVTVGEQPTQRMGQELEPDRERSWAMEQGLSFLRRQIDKGLEVKGNRLLKRTEDVLEGAALDRDVEIETDRFPIAVPALGVAVQSSVRQLEACRIFPCHHSVRYSFRPSLTT